MYTGRKWFVQRYPNLDGAVVAFHQDGPLRAAQTPQVRVKLQTQTRVQGDLLPLYPPSQSTPRCYPPIT
jgi:hypothetical protein